MPSVYIAGAPAAGKSTLMRAVIAELGEPWHWRYQKLRGSTFPGGVQLLGLGYFDEAPRFPGTDRLSMAVLGDALDWLGAVGHRAPVLAEGDRLSSGAWLQACQRLAPPLTVFWLDAPAEVLAKRHRQRGDSQSESWLKGRATKLRRLQEQFPGVTLDSTLPPEANAKAVLEALKA